MKRLGLLIGIATVGSIAFSAANAAATDYSEGQKLFSQKNYRASAIKFETAMKANPRDPNGIYYCALANQLSNNRARARQLYEYLITGFGGSPAATMASTALNQLGGAPASGGGGGVAGSGSSGGSASKASSDDNDGFSANGTAPRPASVDSPEEFRVPFQKGAGGHVMVDGSVNGQGVQFMLDTGAGTTGLDFNHMAALGFGRGPSGQTFKIGGVGTDKVKGWEQKVTLRIGQAYARDFPLTVQDHDAPPLLGQDFLRNFEIDIDPEKSEVVFRKKGARKTSILQPRGTIDVPFTNGSGGHMYVMVEVNGKPYKMMFDTGAGSVAFSFKDMQRLGIEVPDSAREGTATGVAGSVRTLSFPIGKLKMGKIEKEDFTISVSEGKDIPPLLGQSFYGEYKHKVDQEAHVIHFYPAQ